MAKIILIDGIDGTGKHTIFTLMHKYFRDNGYNVINYDFPAYDTPTGQVVKQFLNGDVINDTMNANRYASSLLYTVDRMVYYENHKTDLKPDDIVLFNRSYMSNFFFQTASFMGKTKNLTKYISDVKQYLQIFHFLEVEQTFLKDYKNCMYNFFLYHPNIEINFELARNRGDLDLYEKDLDFQTLVHCNALALYKYKHELGLDSIYPEYNFELIQCSGKNDIKPYPPEDILKTLLAKIL